MLLMTLTIFVQKCFQAILSLVCKEGSSITQFCVG